jgi:hypothetical protein
MPKYYGHACAIADALRRIESLKVVPDPPQTPMMHLHLHVDEKGFRAAARRIAEDEGIFTWTGTAAVDTPSIRGVELTVGDATLTFSSDEVARIVERLANAR